jgi:hypothetical protein
MSPRCARAWPVTADVPSGSWITRSRSPGRSGSGWPWNAGTTSSIKRGDYIFYQRETSPAHQVHIALHEIGHLIADHQGGGGDDELLGLLRPGTPPETVRRALRRTSYDTEQEHAAETVATLILHWASVLDAVVPRLSVGTAERRMQGALGDRMGWL